MKDKKRQWYFFQGFVAAQRYGLIRLDEPDVMKHAQREAFEKFMKSEKEYRDKPKHKVWRMRRK